MLVVLALPDSLRPFSGHPHKLQVDFTKHRGQAASRHSLRWFMRGVILSIQNPLRRIFLSS